MAIVRPTHLMNGRAEMGYIRAEEVLPPELLARLQDYGVASVRGPRGIPEDLLAALEQSGRPVQTS